MTRTLGIDIGGVIIQPAETAGDTSFFSSDFLQTPMVVEAAEVIRELSDEVYGVNIHIISKCGEAVQRKSLQWLEHHNFYERSGVSREHVHFCRNRPDKAPICERLGIDTFIDDRLDVLKHMTSVPNKILFCWTEKSRRSNPDADFPFERALDWYEVRDLILKV